MGRGGLRVRRCAAGARSPEGAGPRGGPEAPPLPLPKRAPPTGRAERSGRCEARARVRARQPELHARAWPGVPAQVGPRGAGCAGLGAPGAALRAQECLTVPERAGAARASAPRRVREDAGSGGGVVSAVDRRGQAASCCPGDPRLLLARRGSDGRNRALWSGPASAGSAVAGPQAREGRPPRGPPAPCSGDPAGRRPPQQPVRDRGVERMNWLLALSLVLACWVAELQGPQAAVTPETTADP